MSVSFLTRMATKPRPNKSFLLRLGSLPGEVVQAAKERTSPIKRPKIEIIGLSNIHVVLLDSELSR